jgi:hypothetical protein
MYVLAKFCQTFRRDLAFSYEFANGIREMQALLDDRLRWPEAATF